ECLAFKPWRRSSSLGDSDTMVGPSWAGGARRAPSGPPGRICRLLEVAPESPAMRLVASDRDHRAVVGAQALRRKMDAQAGRTSPDLEQRADPGVRRDATAQHHVP